MIPRRSSSSLVQIIHPKLLHVDAPAPADIGLPEQFPSFYPSQWDAVTRVMDAEQRFVVLCMPTGCHGRGSPILKYSGHAVASEEIVVGDLLMGPDSRPRRVLALHRGRQRMYRVTPKSGPEFDINLDHILHLVLTPGAKEKTRYYTDSVLSLIHI